MIEEQQERRRRREQVLESLDSVTAAKNFTELAQRLAHHAEVVREYLK